MESCRVRCAYHAPRRTVRTADPTQRSPTFASTVEELVQVDLEVPHRRLVVDGPGPDAGEREGLGADEADAAVVDGRGEHAREEEGADLAGPGNPGRVELDPEAAGRGDAQHREDRRARRRLGRRRVGG